MGLSLENNKNMWPTILTSIMSVINSVLTNKADQDTAKLKILEMQMTGELNNTLAQLDINKNEAASSSVFVAGPRPAILWICAIALFNNFIVLPYATAMGFHVPSLDQTNLMYLTTTLLGLGAMRTYDKVKGVG